MTVPAPPPHDDIAPAPRLPVQSAVYITPDGKVHFGALFEELVPIADALDPTRSRTGTTPKPE